MSGTDTFPITNGMGKCQGTYQDD